MTNFQADAPASRLGWLTPERAVLVLPVAAGLVVAVLLASLALAPLLVRVQGQRERVEGLRRLRDEVPMLRSKLEVQLERLEQRQRQQQGLLALVAGTGELDTFLAQLNALATWTGVVITRAEPGAVQAYRPPPKPVQGGDAPPPPAAGGEGTAPVDPLLREGLERRSAQLGVSGSFTGLLAFMRALEGLEVFVEISDLSLQVPQQARANANAKSGKGTAPAATQLDLSLTLSAYGRQASEPTAAADATSVALPAAAAGAP